MSYQSHEYYLRRAIEISREARAAGNTPFGALLVNKDGDIVMEQGNIEITDKICTGHAEATLAARASHEFTKDLGLYLIYHSGTMRNVCRRHLLG